MRRAGSPVATERDRYGITMATVGRRQFSARIQSSTYELGLTAMSASSTDACSRIVTACAPGSTRTLCAMSEIQRLVPWQ